MASVAGARRYAKALFQLAQEDSSVERLRQELRSLGALLEGGRVREHAVAQPVRRVRHIADDRVTGVRAVGAQLVAGRGLLARRQTRGRRLPGDQGTLG